MNINERLCQYLIQNFYKYFKVNAYFYNLFKYVVNILFCVFINKFYLACFHSIHKRSFNLPNF